VFLAENRRAFDLWWRENHAAGEAGETVNGLKVRFLESRKRAILEGRRLSLSHSIAVSEQVSLSHASSLFHV